MKKKILFVCSPFFGYEKIIIKLMEKTLNYEVFYINPSNYGCAYRYKNKFERILSNLIYKPFLKKDIKEERYSNGLIQAVENVQNFDIVFCIRPDSTTHAFLEYLKSKNKPMIVHHWDSFTFVSKQLEFLKYFDILSSFDPLEAKKYNMKFIPNFYLKEKINLNLNIVPKYDVFTVMKYDDRFKELEFLAKQLKEKNLNYLFIVVTDKKITSKYLTISKTPISLEKNYEYLNSSKTIVEIGHRSKNDKGFQGGLSFRVADSIGNKKKLITTYEEIKEYDFYNKENILIISNNNYKISKVFFENDYEELPKEIYENYSGESWIKKIFKEIR